MDKLATPKPESRLIPTEEEFAAWCEHPVTRFVAASHANKAEDCKKEWVGRSWRDGVADQVILAELRARADTFSAFVEASWFDHLRSVDFETWREKANEQRDREFGPAAGIRGGAQGAATDARPARINRRRPPRAGSGA